MHNWAVKDILEEQAASHFPGQSNMKMQMGYIQTGVILQGPSMVPPPR